MRGATSTTLGKAELRDKFRRYRDLTLYRLRQEGAIIEALPYNLRVIRVTPASATNSPENGGVELEAADYGEALGLVTRFPQLKPVPLARVRMRREDIHQVTTSFAPLARVPLPWHTEHDVREIYPVVLHARPKKDDVWTPEVVLEWYAEPVNELFVNVRVVVHSAGVKVKAAPVRCDGSKLRFKVADYVGLPDDGVCEYRIITQKGRPFVSVYWPVERFKSAVGSLADLLRREVGHV